MDLTYRVHRTSTHPVTVMGTYQGQDAQMVLPELEVELVEPEGKHGSFTMHFRLQSDVAAAREMFVQGAMVTMSFKAADPAPVAEEPETSAA